MSDSSPRSSITQSPLPRPKRTVKRIPNAFEAPTPEMSLSSEASTPVNDVYDRANRSSPKIPTSILRTRQYDSLTMTREKSSHYQSSPNNTNISINKNKTNVEDVSSTRIYFSIPSSPRAHPARTKSSYNMPNSTNEINPIFELNSIQPIKLKESNKVRQRVRDTAPLNVDHYQQTLSPAFNRPTTAPASFKVRISRTDSENRRRAQESLREIHSSENNQDAQVTLSTSSLVDTLNAKETEKRKILNNGNSEFPSSSRIKIDLPSLNSQYTHSNTPQTRPEKFRSKTLPTRSSQFKTGESIQMVHVESSDLRQMPQEYRTSNSRATFDSHSQKQNLSEEFDQKEHEVKVRLNVKAHTGAKSEPTLSRSLPLLVKENEKSGSAEGKMRVEVKSSNPNLHIDLHRSSRNQNSTSALRKMSQKIRSNPSPQPSSSDLPAMFNHLGNLKSHELQQAASQKFKYSDFSETDFFNVKPREDKIATGVKETIASKPIEDSSLDFNKRTPEKGSVEENDNLGTSIEAKKQFESCIQIENETLLEVSFDNDNLYKLSGLYNNFSDESKSSNLPYASEGLKPRPSKKIYLQPDEINLCENDSSEGIVKEITLDSTQGVTKATSQLGDNEFVSQSEIQTLPKMNVNSEEKAQDQNSSNLLHVSNISNIQFSSADKQSSSIQRNESLKVSVSGKQHSTQHTTEASAPSENLSVFNSGQYHEPSTMAKKSVGNDAIEPPCQRVDDQFVDNTSNANTLEPSDSQQIQDETKNVINKGSVCIQSEFTSGVRDLKSHFSTSDVSNELDENEDEVKDSHDAITFFPQDLSHSRDEEAISKGIRDDPMPPKMSDAIAEAFASYQGHALENPIQGCNHIDKGSKNNVKDDEEISIANAGKTKTSKFSYFPSPVTQELLQSRKFSKGESQIDEMSSCTNSSDLRSEKSTKKETNLSYPKLPTPNQTNPIQKFIPIDPTSPAALDALAEAFAASKAIDQEAKKLEQLNNLRDPAVGLKQIGPISEQHHLQVARLDSLLGKRFPLFLITTIIEILHFVQFRKSSTLLRFINLILAVSLYSCVLDRHVQRSPFGMVLNRIAAWLLALLALSISYLTPSDKSGTLDLVNFVGFLIFPLALVDSLGVWIDEIRHRNFQWKGFVVESVYMYGCLICIPAIHCLWGLDISILWAETIYIVSIFTALVVALEYWCVGQVAAGYLPKMIGQSITFFLWGYLHSPGCAVLVGLWNGMLAGGYVYVGLTVLFLIGRILEETLESYGWLQYQEQTQSQQRRQH